MASLREESDSEESSCSLSDNENLAPQKKKRRGSKAQWQDRHVADMADVIFSNDNFPRKLIFTMATASVKTGTQLRSSPSFNNFLKNKIKSLRWVSWSTILIGSYVTFVTFFRWPTYTAVSIQRIKFGRNSTSESAVAFLPHLIELNSTRQKSDVWTGPNCYIAVYALCMVFVWLLHQCTRSVWFLSDCYISVCALYSFCLIVTSVYALCMVFCLVVTSVCALCMFSVGMLHHCVRSLWMCLIVSSVCALSIFSVRFLHQCARLHLFCLTV